MSSRLQALGRAALAAAAGVGACRGDVAPTGPVVASPASSSPASWLPSPPQQHAAWAPPVGALGAKATSAIAVLFDQGLADPRGGAYREIAVRVRSVWGSEEVVRTHGWVIAPSFAVAWSGLVVPIEETAGPADLRADVAAMIARDEDTRAKEARDYPTRTFYRFRHAWTDRASTSFETLLPIRVALLLRLGEGELARRVWDAWHVGMSADTNDDAAHLADPYLMFAIDFTWALFDRAVNAYALGDDRLARASADPLASLHAEVNRVARDRGFTVQGDDYLPFLEPLALLRAELERRRRPVAPPADRVGALIASLEAVAARQMSQPGGVDLARDPAVIALVREGEPAIEPLLAALEGDPRLTRSVSFHRDFSHGRELVPVAEAAYVALSAMLGSATLLRRYPDLTTSVGRREAAAALRAFAAAHRGETPEDRWYGVLADDRSTREQWIEAAGAIAGDERVDDPRGWGGTRPAPRERPPPGEALRSRTPSVTELLVRRLEALRADGTVVGNGSPYRVNVLLTGQIAMALGAWDPKGGADALRAEVDRATRFIRSADLLQNGMDAEYAALLVARHTMALARGGDQDAVPRFTRWLREVSIPKLGTNWRHAFEPTWRYADHPAVRAFLRWAFHDPRSPYLPLLGTGPSPRELDLLETPLVDVPIFKERVVADLRDRRVVGTLRPLSDNGYTVACGSFALSAGAEEPLSFTAPAPIRYCDVIAYALTSFRAPKDAPAFRLYWPEARRDGAIADLTAYLARTGR
jgi:hypothetical protein